MTAADDRREGTYMSSMPPEQWAAMDRAVFDGAGENLQRVRRIAWHRGTSPVGLLLACVLRALSSTPPSVTFDVGLGPGVLNTYLAVVAPPGFGKDRMMRISRGVLRVLDGNREVAPAEMGLGSGEGVQEQLMPTESADGMVVLPGPVLFTASEIGAVDRLMRREGSTLRSTLLAMNTGDPLGFTNRGESMRAEFSSYRAGLWVGVQPDKAGALLSGPDDGLADRFLWTEVINPAAPHHPPGDSPDHLDVLMPDGLARAGFTFAAPIVQEARAVNRRKLRGMAREKDGHRNLTRTKLACGLALLGGASHVTESDWHRAGVLMDYSDTVRGWCQSHLMGKREQQAAEHMEVRERADEQVRSNRLARFRRKVLDMLAAGDVVTRSQVLQSVRSDHRQVMDTALEVLERERLITVTERERGSADLQRNPSYQGPWE